MTGGFAGDMPEIAGAPGEYVFPATPAQAAFWFLDTLAPGTTATSIPVRFRLDGDIRPDCLRRALDAVVARQESLRTTLSVEDGAVRQIVHEVGSGAWALTDLADMPADQRDAECERIGRIEARTPFDLGKGPLLRAHLVMTSRDRGVLHLTLHHAIADGWSVGILMDELAAHYRALVEGGVPDLPGLPVQYADYALWQRDFLEGEEIRGQLDYWKSKLAGLPELALPTDFRRPPRKSWDGVILSEAIPDELADAVGRLAEREGASAFAIYLSTFLTLLHLYTGEEDIAVGSPTAGRTRPEVQQVIGAFINTLIYRVDFGGRPGFREIVRRVRETIREALGNQDVPFDRVVQALDPHRDIGRNPLTQANCTHQRSFIPTREVAGLRITDLPSHSYGTLFDLHFFTVRRDDGWRVSVEYATDLYAEPTARRMLDHYLRILRRALRAPETPLAELDLIEGEERESGRIVAEVTADYPAHSTIHGVFAEVAAAHAGRPALCDDARSLTYAELDGWSDELAADLAGRGVGAGDAVCIAFDRCIEWVVAALGILKAGGCYVPVDPHFPEARRHLLVRDAEIGILLGLDGGRITIHPLPETGARTAGGVGERPAPGPESPAYILFTSGSTGDPKGVVVPHRAVLRLTRGQNFTEAGPDDVFLFLSVPSFDASTFEIWTPLLAGALLRVAPPRIESMADLRRDIRDARVTVLWLTSALFNRIMDDDPDMLAGARQVLTGGEALSLRHVRMAVGRFPALRLTNGYGPTENTTFTSTFDIPGGFDFGRAASIPIGFPVSNTSMVILNGAGRPVPPGMPGELCVGGDGLALGYLGGGADGAGRFVANPLRPVGGPTLYRTGDRARRLEDGGFEFLGRMDAQVKIRGYRVEPGEVEHALRECDGVTEAVVTVQELGEGDRRLIAHVVGPAASGDSGDRLLRELADRLPAFMLPSVIVPISELPLKPSGKVDTAALPDPGADLGRARRATSAVTDTERALAAIWRRVLGCGEVFREDHFFTLGGHSILALRLFVEIERELGLRLPVATVFKYPTLMSLAARLDSERDGDGDGDGNIVVALRPEGERPPICCIHAGDGGILFYRPLAGRLRAGRPVLAVEAPWLTGKEAREIAIPEVASHYLRAIRREAPSGPLVLAGFSFGGIVAYEMARQLEEAGVPPEALILFDTSNPANPPRRLSFPERMARNLRERTTGPGGKITMLVGKAWGKVGAQLHKRREDARVADLERHRRRGGPLPADLRVLDSRNRSLEAMRAYRPRPIRSTMLLITADDKEPGWRFEPDLGWGDLLAGVDNPRIAPVAGSHHTILLEPNVARVAACVDAFLDGPGE